MEKKLQAIVLKYEDKIGCPFKPSKRLFYDVVGINQKRYGQLFRGDKELITSEVKSLSKFFNVSPLDLI